MHMEAAHTHRNERSRQSLVKALLITGTWFFIELFGGLYSNSLALLADAGHMLIDLAALGLSLFAVRMSARPATHRKTYGYKRAEILAALANGLFLSILGLFIGYEAYERFMSPPQVKSLPMLVIAATGLVANLVTAAMLFRTQHENLNIRSAFLHVLGDTIGSVGAIIAGILMVAWQWYMADAAASAMVAVLILIGSWHLVRESVDVLLEGTPRHLKIPEILAELGGVKGVVSVHDLHVWSITSGMPAMSCHVVLQPGADSTAVLHALTHSMRDKYGIEHTTIQIEIEQWVLPQQKHYHPR
jgi:cobalt-zinc-cadmium efflux system protein